MIRIGLYCSDIFSKILNQVFLEEENVNISKYCSNLDFDIIYIEETFSNSKEILLLLKEIEENSKYLLPYTVVIGKKNSPETMKLFYECHLQEYIIYPCNDYKINASYKNALKLIINKSEPNYNYSEIDSIIGESIKMLRIKDQIRLYSDVTDDILLLGETGTGKDLLAKTIHKLSPKSNEKFVAKNCCAIPESLLESELFGSTKGAYTGAYSNRIGIFESAGNGTLFLDEIGDMKLSLQSKFLHVLENRTISRLGSNQEIAISSRFISATSVDIITGLKDGTFRKDLFYRLSSLIIKIPPLRERLEDIPLLCQYFFNNRNSDVKLTSRSIEKLKQYNWPGNIRELFSILLRSIIHSKSTLIDCDSIIFN